MYIYLYMHVYIYTYIQSYWVHHTEISWWKPTNIFLEFAVVQIWKQIDTVVSGGPGHVRPGQYLENVIYTCIHTYIYIYICVHMRIGRRDMRCDTYIIHDVSRTHVIYVSRTNVMYVSRTHVTYVATNIWHEFVNHTWHEFVTHMSSWHIHDMSSWHIWHGRRDIRRDTYMKWVRDTYMT